MDSKVNSLTRALKRLDSDLYVKRSSSGVIHVMRWLNGPKHLFSLTENWVSGERPVDWGIQAVIDHYREGDPDTQGLQTPRLQAERERNEELKAQALKNDIRARAYDVRREVARASNDINTATLEKVDNRRKQDAYS